jgi:hypothetical protein
MNKFRDPAWKERDRNSQLANALYPHLSDPTTRSQMLARAREDGEAKRASFEKRITEGQMSYGKVSPPLSVYDKIPGLRRVEVKATKSWWDR